MKGWPQPIVLAICLFFSTAGLAQLREAAVLDLTIRNGEDQTRLFAAEHAMDVAGIPYFVTTDLTVASGYAMIVTAGRIWESTLDSLEEGQIDAYVFGGGIFVTPRLSDSDLYPVFGLFDNETSRTHYTMSWEMQTEDPALEWFDDPFEQVISIGRDTNPEIIFTKTLFLAGATALATWIDTTPAISSFHYGAGEGIVLGFSFKDLILRPQLNADYTAERSFANGFEPTSDTIMLFLRGLYTSRIAFAPYKHTSPYKSQAALVVTHDVDSTTGMQLMSVFADLEEESGVIGTYNITTHYVADGIATDFYRPFIADIMDMVQRGHILGNHSVGHFPDFGQESNVPEGTPGNTMTNYEPFWDGTQSNNATVFGELEVPQLLLTQDVGFTPRDFRSGHLAFNDKQVNVLDALGIDYDSSRSANDVLTNFPYQLLHDNRFSGAPSSVWELANTISDVFHDDPISEANYGQKADIWIDVTRRNAANSASTVLLIHPNREYKALAQEQLLEALGPEIMYLDMPAYGDYWKRRRDFSFRSEISLDNLVITVPNALLPLDPMQSIVVPNGTLLADVTVQDEDANVLPFQQSVWKDTDLILHAGNHPYLRMVSPNGGESLGAEAAHAIDWVSNGEVGTVTLSVSLDNAETWTILAADLPNTGCFMWTAPVIDLGACLFRVKETAGIQADKGDQVFAVVSNRGDLNENSVRNGTDQNILASFIAGNIQQGAPPFTAPLVYADLNNDCIVNIVDLLRLSALSAN